jgi:hypothetical protein
MGIDVGGQRRGRLACQAYAGRWRQDYRGPSVAGSLAAGKPETVRPVRGRGTPFLLPGAVFMAWMSVEVGIACVCSSEAAWLVLSENGWVVWLGATLVRWVVWLGATVVRWVVWLGATAVRWVVWLGATAKRWVVWLGAKVIGLMPIFWLSRHLFHFNLVGRFVAVSFQPRGPHCRLLHFNLVGRIVACFISTSWAVLSLVSFQPRGVIRTMLCRRFVDGLAVLPPPGSIRLSRLRYGALCSRLAR